MAKVSLIVNGNPVTANIDPRTLLVAETDELPLKQSVREKWMGGNAARVLGLDR